MRYIIYRLLSLVVNSEHGWFAFTCIMGTLKFDSFLLILERSPRSSRPSVLPVNPVRSTSAGCLHGSRSRFFLFFFFSSCYVCSGETVHHTRGYYMINAVLSALMFKFLCTSCKKSDRRGLTRTALKAACPNEQAEICPLLSTCKSLETVQGGPCSTFDPKQCSRLAPQIAERSH